MKEHDGIEYFIRPELINFGAYSAAISSDSFQGKTISPKDIIKLDQNENLYGCSPRAKKALSMFDAYNIYPDAEQTRLREQLSKYTGVGAEYIVAANGSNQLLDLIVRLFVGRDDNVINFEPTFDIYRFSTQICGGKVTEIPREDDFAINIRKVKDYINKRTKLMFIANPNAPTGNLTSVDDVVELLNLGLPTVVDEAYYEFSGITVIHLLRQYPNLMVIRTFSKWAGLAGLRVGYGLFTPLIAGYLRKIMIPYNVNVAALVAVDQSLKDLDYLQGKIRQIKLDKDQLYSKLQKITWLKPYPSQANFILCQLLKRNARDVQQKLKEKGILVRYFDKPRLENCIRISVGKPQHTNALIKVLIEI